MPPPPDFLPVARANAIARKLRAAFAKPTATLRFNPSHETARIAYFPPGLDETLADDAPPGIRFATGEVAPDDDIVLVTAQGADVSATLWGLRLAGFGGVAVVWAWDNHLAQTANLSTAIAADVVIPSHGPWARTLTNPVSIRLAPVHACAAQWTRRDAAALFARAFDVPRGDRLFAPYVDHPHREHAALLHLLDRDMMEAEVLLMPPHDRRRYFARSREDRFAEWAARKVSLVLPMARDLSTRVFDALLAGHTLVAPADLPDLDAVIPPERQRELGIVRFARPDCDAVRAAWREALAVFERGGPEGARRRHEFVLGAHMLEHRVHAIARSLRRLADGTLPVRFGREPEGRAGLIADGA